MVKIQRDQIEELVNLILSVKSTVSLITQYFVMIASVYDFGTLAQTAGIPMKTLNLSLIVAVFLMTSCSSLPTENVSSLVTGKSVEFDLPYEKFTLDNGLEVILHVDKSDPIVALTTVIHAGSNREKPGRTGFAHFFEHMAFNDSENVPRGWNRKAIPDWGGYRNGGTWSDGTIYYEVVPKDAFDKILWIDSDRLGYMINTVTTAAFEREKQVVKNEKRQRVDNAPYGYTNEVIRKALYPETHSYNWTVIGSLPDLQAATLEDLREFYDEYYSPGNATLSIVGDIDIAETKRKVQDWFGEIKAGKSITPLAPNVPVLTSTKSLYFEDNFAKLPELRMVFPTVPSYHDDELALNILADILAGSKNSPLYKQVVEQQELAPSVGSYNNSMELSGEFVFRVRAKAGIDLDLVKDAIYSALADFEDAGVDAGDLQRIKAEQETRLYGSLSTIQGKSRQLATDNEFKGDPGYSTSTPARVSKVTADDLMRVYTKYLKNKPAVMTSFVPKGEVGLALQGSSLASVWIEEVQQDVASEEVSQGEEADYQKTVTNFDRSEPPFGDLPLLTMPTVWERELVNDVMLRGIESSETPLVSFTMTFDGGSSLEPYAKKGAANLLARLMNEGTSNKTGAEFEQAAGMLGSSISVSSGVEEMTVRATTLSRNFEATVALVKEQVLQPRFAEAELERVKQATLTSIKGREANPNAIASLAFNRLLYGDQHPRGLASSGTAEMVTAATLSELEAFHQLMIGGQAKIHIAGDISPARSEQALQQLALALPSKEMELPEAVIPPQKNAGQVFFIDVPGSKQSVILVGKLTLSTLDSDADKLDFTNEKLGGGISGDLAQVLRIEKGYTYGAYSSISTGKDTQAFRLRTSVRANATKASLEVIRDMLRNYGPSYTDEHVEMIKQKLIKETTRAFESQGAKLGLLRAMSKFGKSKAFVEEQQQVLVDMSLKDFRQLASTYLNEEEMVYVIVGDKATQLEPVKEFAGGKVSELNVNGLPD